jgi:hypothetical protein
MGGIEIGSGRQKQRLDSRHVKGKETDWRQLTSFKLTDRHSDLRRQSAKQLALGREIDRRDTDRKTVDRQKKIL